ncbi:hypothetical protein ACFWB0_08735 [Rhodococcus sp. NPDC060086]|uniref:hypothetical protein n=1 Tax=unclassified Rhodococcus (in: high G+C Gram-positive bacteria) TaxID=192944 RepID=UPI0036687618
MWPDHWPTITRRVATTTDAALGAARTEAVPAFDEALDELIALPYEQVTAVHAAMLRELLEELHPDGLTGEDVQRVLERALRNGMRWLPSLQPDAVVAVLTGTLGVHDDEAPKVRPGDYLTAGLLVLADLLAARTSAPGPYLRRAVAEIERSETMEMP